LWWRPRDPPFGKTDRRSFDPQPSFSLCTRSFGETVSILKRTPPLRCFSSYSFLARRFSFQYAGLSPFERRSCVIFGSYALSLSPCPVRLSIFAHPTPISPPPFRRDQERAISAISCAFFFCCAYLSITPFPFTFRPPPLSFHPDVSPSTRKVGVPPPQFRGILLL